MGEELRLPPGRWGEALNEISVHLKGSNGLGCSLCRKKTLCCISFQYFFSLPLILVNMAIFLVGCTRPQRRRKTFLWLPMPPFRAGAGMAAAWYLWSCWVPAGQGCPELPQPDGGACWGVWRVLVVSLPSHLYDTLIPKQGSQGL